jgi:nucleoside-diphosphate-sugar epimerase
MSAGKTILVTGGCGFVGRHLIARLAREDAHAIWVIDDLSTGRPPTDWEVPAVDEYREESPAVSTFRIRGSRAHVRLLRSDFTAIALAELRRIGDLGLPKLPHFDEVYHLASVVGGRNVIDNDPLAVGIDLAIDSSFFMWAAKVGRPGRMLYASSSAAYPISQQTATSAVALSEDMIDFGDVLGKPDYTYGWSKLTGEYLSRIAVEKYGLSVAIVRPFSGYGEDQEPVYPFPAIALRVAARRNPVIVWGDGLQSRDFVHIDDAVEACVLACRKVSDAKAVNIGFGRPTTFRELAARMIEIEGYSATVQGKVDRPVGVMARYCNPARMTGLLQWSPTISLDDGIRRALEYARRRLASGIEPSE